MEILERYKGHAEMLAAFPLVASSHPQAQLILAGDGNDRERLLGIARQLPSALQSRIFMPGYVDQSLLERLYQACFAFALPSRGEGFGLVYLEAMAAGSPALVVARTQLVQLYRMESRDCWLRIHPTQVRWL